MKDFSTDQVQVGIIGAGVMGRGVAQVCIASGLNVVMADQDLSVCKDARNFIFKMLERAVEKGNLNGDELNQAKECLETTTKLEKLSDCDLIIEAVVENLEVKKLLMRDLERLVNKDCILVTNTSSLSVTAIAADCEYPGRVAGFHFFNPVPLMKLVEVVSAVRTSVEVIKQLESLANRIGHTPVIVSDSPGFLVNHCGRGLITEGLRILSENVTDPETVDEVMRECGGFRMGPFELMDLTGLDVTFPATDQIYQQYFHEPRLRPTPLQQKRYQAGLFGRKVGEGFYQYEGNEKKQTGKLAPTSVDISSRFWVSNQCDKDRREMICNLISESGSELDTAENPDKGSIAIVVPLGCDVSTSAIREGLDPSRTVGIETLFNMNKHIVMAKNPATSIDTVNQTVSMLIKSNRTISVINDSAGFITQRIIATIINIACDIAQQGIAVPEDIDRGAKLGLGYPSGPLELGDQLGPENILEILENMQELYGDMRYRPSPWLRRRAQLNLSLLHPVTENISPE